MFIEYTTWPNVKKYYDAGGDFADLAVGSTEEHGRHNPSAPTTSGPTSCST